MSANPDLLGGLEILVEDAVRRVIREELGTRAAEDEYLSVARAAKIADVTPPTIREWIADGKLHRYQAGRELRVKRSDLERLLATNTEPSPEELARRNLG